MALISNHSFSGSNEVMHESRRVGGFIEGQEERLQGTTCSKPPFRSPLSLPVAQSNSPHHLPRAESNILRKTKLHGLQINPMQINTLCKKQTFKKPKQNLEQRGSIWVLNRNGFSLAVAQGQQERSKHCEPHKGTLVGTLPSRQQFSHTQWHCYALSNFFFPLGVWGRDGIWEGLLALRCGYISHAVFA